MTRTLPAILLSFAGAAIATAETTPPTFEERIDVQEVLLDALVTDRQGNVILGLGADDFVVTENGKPVELTDVAFYSNRRFAGSATEAARVGVDTATSAGAAAPDPRYFIVFIHDQRANNVDAPGLLARQLDAGRRLRDWIQDELLRNDWVAVAGWDKKLKVWSDFTLDRDAAAGAVAAAMRGTDPANTWPSRTPVAGDATPSLLARQPRGNDLRDETPTIYEGLSVLAEAAGAVRGRKNLVLLTTGFGTINTFGQYIPDPRYYAPMHQALNDNNVAVYAIDVVPTGTEHTMASAMNQISDETGGRYLYNFTSFATPLRQVSEENGGYYLLSYRSERRAGTSGYQRVDVRARNPEFRVKAREGYRFGEG